MIPMPLWTGDDWVIFAILAVWFALFLGFAVSLVMDGESNP